MALSVVLTRAEGASDEVVDRLRESGFDVVACPLVRIEPIPGPPVRAEGYDWVVLTSARAVEGFFERLEGPLGRVAVIGPGTASALRRHGVEPALVARRSTQEGLLEELRTAIGEARPRVLFAGAEGARELLPRELEADVVALYRTAEERPERFPVADLVVLASASAARSFARLGVDLPAVSIGPITSAEARRVGVRVVTEAESPDAVGVVAAVTLAASLLRSSRS
jgi:uroporphyrinogen III methyltransferase/synthase